MIRRNQISLMDLELALIKGIIHSQLVKGELDYDNQQKLEFLARPQFRRIA